MRRILLTLAWLFATMSSYAETARFYLGAYTKEPTGGKGIYTGTLDTKTGKLGAISLAATAENPSFVSVSADGKYAYAAMEGSSGAVGAYAVQTDGSLKFLNSQPAGGKGTCHVSVDAAGKHVFAANYSSGDIVVFPVQTDGSLGAQTNFKALRDPGRTRDAKRALTLILFRPIRRGVSSTRATWERIRCGSLRWMGKGLPHADRSRLGQRPSGRWSETSRLSPQRRIRLREQ